MPRVLVSLALLSLVVASAWAAPVAVPPDLEPWRGWALDGQEFRRCPFLASSDGRDAVSFRCAWPERLNLTLDARGGRFTQRWQTFAESWVRLPGNSEHYPQDVRVDGAAGAVVMRSGYPSLRLGAGAHAVSGRLSWVTRPESLDVDTRTALIELTLDGRRVAQPERPDGALWLGKRRSAEQPERLEVQVYRLVRDEVPVQLVTRIRLQVSGDAREELLAQALPKDFTPLSLESQLAARLESDGKLRVQVRPGSWELTLAARGGNVATRLARPHAEGLWAREEVWSFAGDDRLRVAAVQGAEGIDPAQANVPGEWRGYPAFRMAADSTLEFVERSRGIQNADDNRLTLQRQLWLDFNHDGFTAVDRIGGTMRRDWRLFTAAPFGVQSARMGEENLLVTRNPDGKGVGVEVRTPNLKLEAVSRSSTSRGVMSAAGWNARFDRVTGVLMLPPGHRLLAAPGADSAPNSWFEQWGLWGVFGVLIVSVFAGWLAGWPVGAIAFVALMLTYQEEHAYIWLWSNLLAAVALARAAPEGRLRNFAHGYRVLSFAVLGFALLPLLWGQVRLALYPQLESFGYANVGYGAGYAADAVRQLEAPQAIAPPQEAKIQTDIAEVMVTGEKSARNAAEVSSLAGSTAPGLNYSQVVQRYAPGTLLQAGPGIPSWRYLAYPYSWSGPVEPGQTVRFLYIGPVLLAVWRIVGVALLAALFVALLQVSGTVRWVWPRRGQAAAIAISLLAIMITPHARAASPVDSDLLEELKTRLTRPADCIATCADIASARVSVHGDRLDVTLEVSALATVAVAMPGAGDRWQLDSVTVDNRASLSMARESDGTPWIPLTVGAHTVRLSGQLASAESIQLAFPTPPRRIAVDSDGWDVAGVNDDRLVSGSVELTRRRSASEKSVALESASEFPAFVRVRREFDLGLDWNVTTTVERIAPEKASIAVEVPLMAGESVLSEGIEVRAAKSGARVALVGIERGQQSVQWTSGLARGDKLTLALPVESARTEVWRFSVSPQWNVTFAGFPAVLPQDSNAAPWVYEFYPRGGEQLHLQISRPQRADGATLAIDSVLQGVDFGKRSATTNLTLNYRSTQGGRHGIALPKGARVTAVKLDGQAVQLRPVDGELSIGLLPGAHAVNVEWTAAVGAALRSQPPAVDLHSPASNVLTRLNLPDDRWPLFVQGAGVGPALVYWGELVIFIAVAVLLGRWSRSPLRTHEWLLLGLGLSTRSWAVLAVVAIWLFVLRWRETWGEGISRWRFNLVQVALAALTFFAVGGLVFSGIRGSLLASPDMGVRGPGSYGGTFEWFMDRTASMLPQPEVISAPMWLYRVLMFAWALWLAFALLKWLRWAWSAWKVNGIWRDGKPTAVQPTP